MTFNDYSKKYEYQYHTYPVYSQDMSSEGAFKRFMSMPGPKEVFDYAMMGLPKHLPLTNEIIASDGIYNRDSGLKTSDVNIADFLTSAVTEIELSMDCNISEVTHFASEDDIDGNFTNNYLGVRLSRWPATEITQVILKYPHAHRPDEESYKTYTLPASWIYLHRNKVNVIASIGAVAIQNGVAAASDKAGFLTYIAGFNRGPYTPGTIEVVYKAGFSHDKLPAAVADLIKTWAAHRYLTEISPVLFPQNSVTVSIDGISQSVGFDIQRLIGERLSKLEEKKNDLKRAFKKGFGQTVGASFIGA